MQTRPVNPPTPDEGRTKRTWNRMPWCAPARESHSGGSVRNAWRTALLAVLLSAQMQSHAADPLTQAELLDRVIDVDRLMLPPSPSETSHLVAGIAGNATTAPQSDAAASADAWQNVFRVSGPGVITRMFVAKPGGEFRLRVDGTTELSGSLDDLFEGRIAPISGPITHRKVADGAGVCYFPIAFEKECQIDLRGAHTAYQISYTTPERTPASFNPSLDESARVALEHVNRALAGGYSEKRLFAGKRLMPVLGSGEIKPGESLVESLEGAGTIRAFYVNFPNRRTTLIPGTLHQVLVRVFFDGDGEPSIEAPLPDFFGAGFGLVDCAGLPIGTRKWIDVPADRANQNEFCYCYFPMPYRKGVRIEFRNLSDMKVDLTYFLRVQLGEPPADALRFYARFRREPQVKSTDYLLLETGGPGRFVGALINVDAPRYDWWGAGGESFRIDGKDALRGDDIAHYLGDAAPLHALSTALHGVTRTASAGKTSAYRWHLADAIPFAKSARLMLHPSQSPGKSDLYLSSIAYWYAPADTKHRFRTLKPDEVQPLGLRLPGAVEVEGNIQGQGWGREVRQRDAMGFEYSGGAAALIESSTAVTVEIPMARAKSGMLKLRLNQLRGFERVDVTAEDGTAIGSAVYDRARSEGVYEIGRVDLKAGANRVRITCSRPAALDCWLIE